MNLKVILKILGLHYTPYIMAFLLLFFPCVVIAESKLLFSDGFESGEMSIRCSGNCPTITTSPVRAGRYAMKTLLGAIMSQDKRRTEISIPGNAVIGEHYWYGFSIFLPKDYSADKKGMTVTQWHGVPDMDIGEDWRNPVMTLRTSNGKWEVNNIWDAKRNTFESGKRVYDGSKNWDLGHYDTEEWTDWVFHVKWSFQVDGLLEVWRNGKKVIIQKGPNCYNDKKGVYLKMGLYQGWKNGKHGIVFERVIYQDEIRIRFGPEGYNLVSPFTKALP